MYFLKVALLLIAAGSFTLAEVIDFKPCDGDLNDCTIDEVRVDPCPQAASHTACNIRRRKATKMAFDFTPKFDADTLDANLVWVKNDDQELPLVTMERDGCKFTTCPVQSGQQQTYSLDVPIESKFPTSTYKIKWTLKAPNGKQCCFMHDIKVVR